MVSLNRTGVISGAVVASLGVIAVAGIGVASAHHNVTVEVGGTYKVLHGFYPTVQDALNGAGIELGPEDEVTPAVNEDVQDDQMIEVFRAQPYRVQAGGRTTTEWSPAVSLDAVFDDIATGDNGSVTVSRTDSRDELPLAEDARTVTVKIDDKPTAVKVAGGEQVLEILTQADFDPSPLDEVRVERFDGQVGISVVTETRKIDTSTQDLAFTEQEVEDPDLEEGTRVVTQKGEAGARTVVRYKQIRGGQTVVDAVLSDNVTKKPVIQVVSVGTKAAPTSSTIPSTNSSVGGDVWAALAQCESGGNPATNTGNGYYGLYQFSEQTWGTVGGSGLPSDASAEEQTARAQILQQRAGWGQWPGCAASLGLY